MSRSSMLVVGFGLLLAVLALAYFALIVARPRPLARVLLRRGYEERGWDESRLALRLRLVGIAGGAVALAGILLAVARFVR